MRNLENRCAWKEIVEIQVLAEGKMKMCRKCEGYNESCYAYFSTKEKETKLRIYKVK